MGGVMLVGAMGCQQAPPPAPTVVVEHRTMGMTGIGSRQPPPPQDRRGQDQRDQNRQDPRITGMRLRLLRGSRSKCGLHLMRRPHLTFCGARDLTRALWIQGGDFIRMTIKKQIRAFFLLVWRCWALRVVTTIIHHDHYPPPPPPVLDTTTRLTTALR